ncbi:aminotransferase class IV family protein [Embleya sp. NPDC005971]|uniref:aminotransferase class IV family protein n=1 Tax=Embleya sp. NPDC005971 TaxID=3156724 RepID=UPI0033FC21BE
MSASTVSRVEIDGRPTTVERLHAVAVGGYGHFTAMQVRGGRVRGLADHLRRLDAANRELFGSALDGDLIRRHIRHALADDVSDASVRVHVLAADEAGATAVLVTVRPPGDMPPTPQALRSVPYLRAVPHIKRVGDFGQAHFRRQATREGFDEALLTGPDRVVAEGAITNIVFHDGTSLLWPDAPVLEGITMQLLERALATGPSPSRRGPVHLSDVGSFRAAFVTNSRGIAPVRLIDDVPIPVDTALTATLGQLYASIVWDRI